MTEILLYTSNNNSYSVPILWALGGLLLLFLSVYIFHQYRTGKKLKDELAELEKVKQTDIEHEFILKAMKLSTWRLDAKTKSITYENDFRDRQDNYTPPPGSHISESCSMIVANDADRVANALDEICSGQTGNYHQQYQVRIGNSGKTYWEESYATVAERDVDGKPTKIVGTSMRVDERKALEESLVNARNKAEESDRLKTAFLANMGHEIRTPLNAIVGFADLLPVVQNEEDRNQLISEIQANNRKLLRIIDGLVSMSKIEAGAKSLSMSAININTMLEQTVSSYQPTTSVPITTELPLPQLEIRSDREKLTEIIDNLMQNAVKFTSEGSIVLGYELDGDQIRIWVRDTGKGIAESDQKRIFERFVKVDEYIPGTGLGLSVVQSHAQSLGGDVGLMSRIGEGSTFWVLLPIN